MYASESYGDLDQPSGQINRIGLAGRARASSHKSLVLVSANGIVPECVLEAVERAFPRLSIEQVRDIDDIGVDFGQPVGLFLVESVFLPRLDEQMKRCRGRHPNAGVAVLFEDMERARAEFASICSSDFVRGVLPMNLKLDVWLSVVGLLLRGGEYVPTSLFRSGPQERLRIARSSASSQADKIPAPVADRVATDEVPLNALTEREHEILQRVAQGTQNKVIASDLGVSEHTVKIHLHNIIRKLRVRNRTEAAAMFLQASWRDTAGPANNGSTGATPQLG
jgi:DNA-binding NarL/FixJ family response regulator